MKYGVALEKILKQNVRKAQKQLEVIEDPNVEQFLEQQKTTFARQGKPLPYPEEVFRRLDSACASEEQGRSWLLKIRKRIFTRVSI